MSKFDEGGVVRWYEQRIGQYGAGSDDAIAVSAFGHRLVQSLFLQVYDGGSVLDVGCATGSLAARLPIGAEYLGVDVVEEFLDAARVAHPDRSFLRHDVGVEPVPREFDFVALIDVIPVAARPLVVISNAWQSAKRCLFLTATSSFASKERQEMYGDFWYADPAELVAYVAQNCSPYVMLRHDFMPHAFALAVWRPPEIDVALTRHIGKADAEVLPA